ncbi:MAG: chloride channel protein [Frankiales bacterium]|nr:chloride channel protein [Frankiales bacterium]
MTQTPAEAAAPSLGGPAFLRLVMIGAVVGVPAALVAVGFLAVVHVLEHLLWTSWPQALGLSAPPAWMVVGLPVAGALMVWAARTLLPGDGGHEPLDGISVKPTPVSYAPSVILAAVASLAFGAVLGPEAPLIALGSVVGMLAVRWWKVSAPGDQVISTAGVFSAVSALFGGPVVAGVLLLEAGVALGASVIPVMLPGLVSAAVGYVLITGIGDWGGVPTGSLTVPDLAPYPTTRIADLFLAVVIGLVVSILVQVVRRLGHVVRSSRGRFGAGPVLLAGGLAVGLLALATQGLGGDSQNVLFSGQFSLPALVDGSSSQWVLLVTVLAKLLGYAICLGAGFRGGPVFPAIFIGVGTAVLIGTPFGMSTTAALAIGTACGMAAFTRLIFASLVFAILISGAAALAAQPAAVLAAATAWVVGKVIDQRGATAPTAPPPRAAT